MNGEQMVRQQSIKQDFLPLKLTISASELRTTVVAHYGAAQWMGLSSAVSKIACVHKYSSAYPIQDKRMKCPIRHICECLFTYEIL